MVEAGEGADGGARAPAPRAWQAGACLAVAAAVFLAYYPALDNYFLEIDDALHLASARDGAYASPHFRPLHHLLFLGLYRLCGTHPAPYYAASLALHLCCALLLLRLVRLLTGECLAALIGALAFAVFYAPHEAVLWISANTTLLVAVFVLACVTSHVLHLQTGRLRHFCASLVFMAGAMCSKEECVVLALFLPAVEAAWGGWRSLWRKASLLRYGAFALLAAAYLAVAFRPELWQEAGGVARYELGADLFPRLARSLGWLFWLRPFHEGAATAPCALPAGVALAVCALLAARRMGAHGRLLLVGLAVALGGFLPLLPGPFEIVAKRYAYVSSIGAALMVAAVLAWLLQRVRARFGRGALLIAFLAWLALQMVAIHAVEGWRFERSCARFRGLMESTRAEVVGPAGGQGGVVVSPIIWNVQDYLSGLYVILDLPRSVVSIEAVPWPDRFTERLLPGNDLDLAACRVFACRGDGLLRRLTAAKDAPVDWWNQQARDREKLGQGRTIALVRFLAGAR